jgi:hypothetical protein
LHVQRLVEAESGFHLGDDLGGGLGRHEHVDRVSRDDMHEAEDDEGHAKQDGDSLQEASKGEDKHAVRLLRRVPMVREPMLRCSNYVESIPQPTRLSRGALNYLCAIA